MDTTDPVVFELRKIHKEVRTTNASLESLENLVDQTNSRLESLEQRVDVRFESLEQRMGEAIRRQAESEMRLTTEVIAMAKTNQDIRKLLEAKLEDHEQVIAHEHRITVLEAKFG